MKYTGNTNYKHDAPPCTGILITNLGTPDAPTTPAVHRYLAEFLSDTRVIETSKLIWQPILHGIILRTRPQRSAAAYAEIWTDAGSPLLVISKKQAIAIDRELQEQCAGPVQVELAMRYGNPSIASALEKLRKANAQRLLIFPLYPHYSAATTGSTFDAVARVLQTWRWVPELRMINHYHDHPDYIDALVESIRRHWATHGKPDKLLFSFHGLPKKHFLAGDPYFCQCHTTARLTAARLELADDKWTVSFQSRFGAMEWLKPYTDKLLKQWGKAGIKNVHILCPGFSADCLETLEEIQMRNKEFFLHAGGKQFSYIPALNDDPNHIQALCKLIAIHCQGWPEFAKDYDANAARAELQQREQRAVTAKNKIRE